MRVRNIFDREDFFFLVGRFLEPKIRKNPVKNLSEESKLREESKRRIFRILLKLLLLWRQTDKILFSKHLEKIFEVKKHFHCCLKFGYVDER